MKKYFLLILISLIVLVSGCNTPPVPYKPNILVDTDTSLIQLTDGETSPPRIIEITKNDDDNIDTSFLIRFRPSDTNHVQVLDDFDNEITSIKTDVIRSKSVPTIGVYKIKAFKLETQPDVSNWALDIEVIYNETEVLYSTKIDIKVTP